DDGKPLPALAAVAMQQGTFVGEAISREVRGQARGRFEYKDRGLMATIGRSRAVVQSAHMQLRGFVAWLLWTVVHIWYLMGRRTRLAVLLEWFWAWATYKRGARLILDAPRPRDELIALDQQRKEELGQTPSDEPIPASRKIWRSPAVQNGPPSTGTEISAP
ncbi:MAG: NAD(P)/FAD-dependent oxidoreductase, partial [Myxococcota bacterium]